MKKPFNKLSQLLYECHHIQISNIQTPLHSCEVLSAMWFLHVLQEIAQFKLNLLYIHFRHYVPNKINSFIIWQIRQWTCCYLINHCVHWAVILEQCVNILLWIVYFNSDADIIWWVGYFLLYDSWGCIIITLQNFIYNSVVSGFCPDSRDKIQVYKH